MRFIRPDTGEVRQRSAFLFWPKTIGHETRWLERAKWMEVCRYTNSILLYGVPLFFYEWEPRSWCE